jgi:hypothetical protein
MVAMVSVILPCFVQDEEKGALIADRPDGSYGYHSAAGFAIIEEA